MWQTSKNNIPALITISVLQPNKIFLNIIFVKQKMYQPPHIPHLTMGECSQHEKINSAKTTSISGVSATSTLNVFGVL